MFVLLFLFPCFFKLFVLCLWVCYLRTFAAVTYLPLPLSCFCFLCSLVEYSSLPFINKIYGYGLWTFYVLMACAKWLLILSISNVSGHQVEKGAKIINLWTLRVWNFIVAHFMERWNWWLWTMVGTLNCGTIQDRTEKDMTLYCHLVMFPCHFRYESQFLFLLFLLL